MGCVVVTAKQFNLSIALSGRLPAIGTCRGYQVAIGISLMSKK